MERVKSFFVKHVFFSPFFSHKITTPDRKQWFWHVSNKTKTKNKFILPVFWRSSNELPHEILTQYILKHWNSATMLLTMQQSYLSLAEFYHNHPWSWSAIDLGIICKEFCSWALFGKSLIKIRNKTGPIIDPWGIPLLTPLHEEGPFLSMTLCRLPLIHCFVLPLTR